MNNIHYSYCRSQYKPATLLCTVFKMEPSTWLLEFPDELTELFGFAPERLFTLPLDAPLIFQADFCYCNQYTGRHYTTDYHDDESAYSDDELERRMNGPYCHCPGCLGMDYESDDDDRHSCTSRCPINCPEYEGT